MEGTIALQIAGCVESGFTTLMKINWPGRNLSDQMPGADRYTSPIAWQVKIDSEYQTYEAVICKFAGLDGRNSTIQIALRIPVGCVIVEKDDNSGRISPAAVLRPILDKVINEHLKVFEGTYEYRGRQVPAFVSEQYAALLAPYKLEPVWGPMIETAGSRPIYINGVDDADIDEKMLAVPFIPRLSDASMVEIGAYTASVPTTALTDAELHPQVKIDVRIADNLGIVTTRSVDAIPLHLDSTNYGYSEYIYRRISIKIDREGVLKAYAAGCTTIENEGVKIVLYPRRGEVSVSFNPELREKTYAIELKGKDTANRENEIFDQLQFRLAAVTDKKLIFKGEDIVKFESLNGEELTREFSLTRLAKFNIESARREGTVVRLSLKSKEEPRPVATPAPAPRNAGGAPANTDDAGCRKKLHIVLNDKYYKKGSYDVVVRQEAEARCTTVYDNVPVVNSAEERYLTVEFAEISGHPSITAKVGRPAYGFNFARRADRNAPYDYETVMTKHKNGFSRFFSTFCFVRMRGLWPFWRGFTMAMSILLLAAACFVGGMYTFYWCMNNDKIDCEWFKAPKTETVAPEPEKTDPPKEEPKVPVDTTTNALANDSIQKPGK